MERTDDILATPRNLGALVRRLIDQLDGAVEESYRDAGLDYRPRYTPIVRALFELGPCSMPALARHMGLSQSTVTQTVTEMVVRELIVASRQDEDARVRLVTLSPRMLAMLPKIERCWDATEAASATLNGELDCNLPEILGRAIALLEHRSLSVRIMEARLRLEAAEKP
jgi:DNA-binding MarR family transcriptional regulator